MYSGYIVVLKDFYEHPNADRLQCVRIFDEQVIVSFDYKEGDRCVYFPSDGILSKELCEDNKLLRKDGGFVYDNRRVKVINLVGEKSDGLLLPINVLSKYCDISKLKEGDKIDTLNGHVICKKYVPPIKKGDFVPIQKKKKRGKDKYPFFAQHVDTPQLRFYLNELKPGDEIIITEKIHSTSGRSAYTIREFKKPSLINKIFRKPSKTLKEWVTIAGSRRVNLTKTRLENDTSFYGSDEFRSKVHDQFADKLEKGEEIFYEITGYAGDKPLMPSCDNRKIGEEFVQKYGDITEFKYGTEPGENDVWVHRMTITNEDGYVVEYPWDLVKIRCEQMGLKYVPELTRFIYTTEEDFLDKVHQYEDGPSTIDPTHIREGVVVRVNNKSKIHVYKQKNINFKILEGIIKENALTPDREEMEEVENG